MPLLKVEASEDLGICRHPGTNPPRLPGEDYITPMRWLWAPSLAEVAVAFTIWRGEIQEMHGKQLLNLEQNSFILWNPKGQNPCGLKGAVNLDFTDTYKRCKVHLKFRALEPLAGC